MWAPDGRLAWEHRSRLVAQNAMLFCSVWLPWGPGIDVFVCVCCFDVCSTAHVWLHETRASWSQHQLHYPGADCIRTSTIFTNVYENGSRSEWLERIVHCSDISVWLRINCDTPVLKDIAAVYDPVWYACKSCPGTEWCLFDHSSSTTVALNCAFGVCCCWQVMLRSTRTMFGKHKQGHIFPIIISANTLDTCFAGVIHKVHCPDEFIWFYSKSLIVCAASLQSLELMGVRGFRHFLDRMLEVVVFFWCYAFTGH